MFGKRFGDTCWSPARRFLSITLFFGAFCHLSVPTQEYRFFWLPQSFPSAPIYSAGYGHLGAALIKNDDPMTDAT